MKRSHGQVISAAVMGGGLRCKVIRRIKGVASVKALLILTVTMLHLSVNMHGSSYVGGQAPQLFLNRVCRSRLLAEKRLVNSKPLSV